MKVYSTDRVPGVQNTTVLKETPYEIMWTRGNGFYVSPRVILKKRLDTLVEYCLQFDKTILLFSNSNGGIRSDIFWTRSPGEPFWKECLEQDGVIDTVYRDHINDPGILVLSDAQSYLFFT